MIVTTAERADEALVHQALALAEELGARYAPRRRETLKSLSRSLSAAEDEGILVVGEGGLRYVKGNEPPLFFHPSMGLVRAKRLRDGGTDNMIETSGASTGDVVLDCTAGLCSDAIVFACAVGGEGTVTALEASPLLHVIVREGLRTYKTDDGTIDAALRRIKAVRGDYNHTLPSYGDKSVDIVYFDPMFERPVTASASLQPLRAHAVHTPLSESALRHAIRVARKAVVLKDHRESGEFRRLGFYTTKKTTKASAYGVIHI